MKFRIAQSPENENEGKEISLEAAAELLSLDMEVLYWRAYFAVSVAKDGYILEVIKEGGE